MFKKILFSFFIVLLLYCFIVQLLNCLIVKPVWANNIYGIHILETTEVEQAASLVNSSGGDWGYVTIVLRDDDLQHDKWQAFFDECRKLHLIPIIRIATHMIDGGLWAKPRTEELELAKWPRFLNQLNWPVKQQIVVIFNEPNHSKEWGGEISPREYTQVLEKLIELFKKENSNFYILNAGFDQAADGRNGTLREEDFLKQMFESNNDIFNQLDGWCSHSYPNHGFVGTPQDTGKATIKGYEWELEQLKRFSLVKELSVFITETGWPHQEGVVRQNYFYPSEQVAVFMEDSFKIWEQDSKVMAVTPFVLNYPKSPFDNFSWFSPSGDKYFQYDKVQGLVKKSSKPEQEEGFEVIDLKLGEFLPTNHIYGIGQVTIKNTGQWIMGERGDFYLKVEQSAPKLDISSIRLAKNKLVKPGDKVVLDFVARTGTKSAEHKLHFGNKEHTLYVYKPFDWKNKKVSLWKQIITSIKLWWDGIWEK